MVGKTTPHKPVLVEEVLKNFNLPVAPLQFPVPVENKKIFADLTLGAGGHASEIVKRGGYVIGIEADEKMIEIARKVLEDICGTYPACPADNFESSFKLFNDNFTNLDKIVNNLQIGHLDGVLIDLGVSSVHMDDSQRGFSFKNPDAPLDMRISKKMQNVDAKDLLNALPKDGLQSIFDSFLDYHLTKRLVEEVVDFRSKKKFEKVGDLLSVLSMNDIKHRLEKGKKVHFATIPFMALRVAVNSELPNLSEILPISFGNLGQNGILQVISFHSTEDGIVKSYFKIIEKEGIARVVNNKPIVPNEREKIENPRSRSAKLRAIKKL